MAVFSEITTGQLNEFSSSICRNLFSPVSADPEMLQAIEAEKLARDVQWSMSVLRNLGKGATLTVSGKEADPVHSEMNGELDFLTRHFDSRSTEFTATATGTLFGSGYDNPDRGIVFIPMYNVERISFRKLKPIFDKAMSAPLLDAPGSRTLCGRHSISDRIIRGTRPLSEAFQSERGVSLESVVALICNHPRHGCESMAKRARNSFLANGKGHMTVRLIWRDLKARCAWLPGTISSLQFPVCRRVRLDP